MEDIINCLTDDQWSRVQTVRKRTYDTKISKDRKSIIRSVTKDRKKVSWNKEESPTIKKLNFFEY